MHVVSGSSARYVRVFTALVVVWFAGGVLGTHGAVDARSGAASADAVRQNGELWLAPAAPSTDGTQALGQAAIDLAGGRASNALPVFKSFTSDPVLGGYALLYAGRSQAAMGKWTDAAETAQQLIVREPDGYLSEAAQWLAADAAENTGNVAKAIVALQALTTLRPITPERAWLRLGRAAERSGDKALAAMAFWKVYYDYPLSDEADDAALNVARLPMPEGRTADDR